MSTSSWGSTHLPAKQTLSWKDNSAGKWMTRLTTNSETRTNGKVQLEVVALSFAFGSCKVHLISMYLFLGTKVIQDTLLSSKERPCSFTLHAKAFFHLSTRWQQKLVKPSRARKICCLLSKLFSTCPPDGSRSSPQTALKPLQGGLNWNTDVNGSVAFYLLHAHIFIRLLLSD